MSERERCTHKVQTVRTHKHTLRDIVYLQTPFKAEMNITEACKRLMMFSIV